MKQLLGVLFFAGLSLQGLGQSNALLEFHNKYKDYGDYFSFRIEGGLLKALSRIETDDPEAGDFLEMISKIDAIDIHSIHVKESDFGESDFREITRKIKKEKFEDLITVVGEDKKINFLVRESGGKITDLLLIINHPEEFTLLNISGEIDLSTISKLSKCMDFKGSGDLANLDKE
ncbi:MAG TPA: DUF4252 domain-containing protein [Cyclobacteriaceae bacterium]|nr:DUF4252 domain-containing protein [Cyclobacteriaceae bacterium]